jgi:transcription-repair coupling factor (superfamily II helicase)
MKELLKAVANDPGYRQLQTAIEQGDGTVAVFGLPEAHRPAVNAALAEDRTVVWVVPTPAEAMRLFELQRAYRPDTGLYLPRELPLTHLEAVSSERRAQRLSVLSRLALGVSSLLITCPEALMERLVPHETFLSQIVRVQVGDTIDPRMLLKRLLEAGYERAEQIEGPGQCASRGDILDVYPPQAELPYRIEFFGDDVDQMRVFDPLTQRSVEQVNAVVLPPAFETPQTEEAMARALRLLKNAQGFDAQRESWKERRPCVGADVLVPLLYPVTETLLDYLPENSAIVMNDPGRLADEARAAELVFSETVAATLERGEGHPSQGKLLIGADAVMRRLDTRKSAAYYALFRPYPNFKHRARVGFSAEPAPAYLNDSAQFLSELDRLLKAREAVLLYVGEARERMKEILADSRLNVAYADTLTRAPVRGEALILSESLPQGFSFPELHLYVLTAQELFGKKPAAHTRKKGGTLKFTDLAVGDYVVHEAHGIGRFMGVESLTVQNSTKDYLLFAYRGDDRLYIPTDQLDRIQKYVGADAEVPPQLSKLGGTEWQQRVQKAREGAKKLAVDLARLYAARTEKGGFAFSKDSAWQKRLEDAFPYEETPDQAQAIKDVKADMESPRPMDRLLCGDVGYGKTEVAMRAAFKAAQDSKQTAFLVPTTILAQQHYHTLLQRFSDFPVRVACLSRFQSPKECAEVKKGLASGEIDVVVGTHALLAKSVQFKNLGLLIIDEEHRFGVNHKEQIKALRNEIDVLTLTATPIPRTLNLSMTGIRDISTIETPPENRFPVQTFVMEYNDAFIAAALQKELARGGQAFVVSNRVLTMGSTLTHLQALLPEARIAMAHGQMPEAQLEETMMAFLNREIDVLLCSTIVESGVDIPNANTLVVLEADKLGLAQLYQLRGRVGRSTRMAYAYLTVPQARAVSETAQKRLLAIREFTQFGAGFRLAMRDLEIRGAGSLLGAEQHGHIADVGYEFYCKLMRNAVAEAKGETPAPEIETTVDAPIDAYIPKTFLPSELHRLAMYKRIAQIGDNDSYTDLLDEFNDRYGDLPEPVMTLMQLALIRAYASRAGFASVTVRDGKTTLTYDAAAKPDGMRLLAVLSSEPDLRLLANEPAAIVWTDRKRVIRDFVKNLPQLIYRLMHCIDSDSGV